MLGKADLAKLSGQKFIQWHAVRKEEISYTHAISSYGNSLVDTWDLECIKMVPPEELRTPTTKEGPEECHRHRDPW